MDCFGSEGMKVFEFLNEVDKLPTFRPSVADEDRAKTAEQFTAIHELCDKFSPVIDARLNCENLNESLKTSWTYLSFYVRDFLPRVADAYVAMYRDEREEMVAKANALMEYMFTMEGVFPACCDAAIYNSVVSGIFPGSNPSNAVNYA